MKDWLIKVQQSGASFWSARDARERKVLLLAAVFIAVVLIYLALIAPALKGRAQLRAALPQLHEQVTQMQALSNDASRLSTAVPAAREVMSKDMLVSALSAHGLKAISLNISGTSAQLQLKETSFAQTLAFLEEIQQSAQVSVMKAKISALDKADMIDASLTLYQVEQP